MTFKEFVNEVMSLPGCFVVFNEDSDQSGGSTDGDSSRLNIFKEKDKAERVLSVFHASKQNSLQLLDDARVLMENGSYARAVALAIMAYEELGKSQIAADYYSGILPESEYKNAFRLHTKTAYANRYAAIGSNDKVRHGYYVDNEIAKMLESFRQVAFYVGEDNMPLDNFDEDDARMIIDKVNAHHDAIQYAEWLNGRIGSKALFK